VGFDLPNASLRPGDTITLTLYWKADSAVDTSYTVFMHLVGKVLNPAQKNYLWGQVDQIPGQGARPATAWAVGQVIPDGYALPIQPNAPAGTYQIEIGLYDTATGTRLKMDDGGDALVIEQVQVQ
jgi:hypothetical protein